MLRLFLFLLLVGMPIAEIAVFIVLGGQIGALPTIAIIILTALIGAILLRRQGAAALAGLQRDLDRGEVPASSIGHAITVAIAGLLLLTPGFITDAVGFALFVPAVRRWLWRYLSGVVHIKGVAAGRGFRPRGGQTVDLDEDDYTTHSGPRGSAPAGAPPLGTANPESPWNPPR